jgi:hypothetical protein
MTDWLWQLLKMDQRRWTWWHTLRFGRNPTRTANDFRRYNDN